MGSGPIHLTKRFFGALSRREPVDVDLEWVSHQLAAGEFAIWSAMEAHDRRHSIMVARRFCESRGVEVSRDEIAAALLHDVGKLASGLGVMSRILATLVGPRGRRFSAYHRHESIGADMCAAAGSTESTLAILRGTGDADVIRLLRLADDL